MDDCSQPGVVTDYLLKSSGAEGLRDYFVTIASFGLSLTMVWTGLALHG
jgi:hypothetical protein